MNTNFAITGTAPGLDAQSGKAQDRTLRTACREFEGVMLGIILKDGLKTDSSEEDAASGGDIFQEFATEQAARALGQTESFGLAKMMYDQLSGGKVHAK